MKAAAVLFISFFLASAARAAEHAPPEALFELKIDLDRDSTMDRVVLVGGPGSDHHVFMDGDAPRLAIQRSPDLYIYFGSGDATLDLSRKPDAIKPSITSPAANYLYALQSKTPGAFIVSSAHNLYGSTVDEKVTIAFRQRALWVVGYEAEWEMAARRGANVDVGYGRCEIDFSLGKGRASRGLDGALKPIHRTFARISLAEWRAAAPPPECRPR